MSSTGELTVRNATETRKESVRCGMLFSKILDQLRYWMVWSAFVIAHLTDAEDDVCACTKVSHLHGEEAFANFGAMKTITVLNTVETIGSCALYKCIAQA